MSILKLNRIVYLLVLILLFSCKQTVVKTYENDNCEVFVAGKKGFWIDVYSTGLQENSVVFRVGNKHIITRKTESGIGNISYFITESVKLKDTLAINYKGKIYKVYEFKNLKETAIDGEDHKHIGICRVATARINGQLIQDSRNNVLSVVLE